MVVYMYFLFFLSQTLQFAHSAHSSASKVSASVAVLSDRNGHRLRAVAGQVQHVDLRRPRHPSNGRIIMSTENNHYEHGRFMAFEDYKAECGRLRTTPNPPDKFALLRLAALS